MKLTIELVPSSSFYQNVRAVLSPAQWRALSKQVRSEAYDICEICGASSEQSLDCHEVWNYDDKKQIQKLVGLRALCKKCHGVKHFGLSQIRGAGERSLKHLMEVNGLDRKRAEKYIADVFMTWAERSSKSWKLDVSYLKEYGIDTTRIGK